uniref:Kinesin motor domain-containing protein n=1 Tax=Steinernema glaseri TaxID=37863 RepID=A0A1I8AS95_9BILA
MCVAAWEVQAHVLGYGARREHGDIVQVSRSQPRMLNSQVAMSKIQLLQIPGAQKQTFKESLLLACDLIKSISIADHIDTDLSRALLAGAATTAAKEKIVSSQKRRKESEEERCKTGLHAHLSTTAIAFTFSRNAATTEGLGLTTTSATSHDDDDALRAHHHSLGCCCCCRGLHFVTGREHRLKCIVVVVVVEAPGARATRTLREEVEREQPAVASAFEISFLSAKKEDVKQLRVVNVTLREINESVFFSP